MSPATIRDVAKAAGVGVGTVSRVINNHPSVRASTRQKVEAAIAALNYTPNPIARQLSWGKTLSVAVVAPFFIRPSSVERLQGVETVLSEANYDLVLFNVETQSRRNALFRTLPRGDSFDGILVVTLSPQDYEAEFLLETKIPIVLVDANHPKFNRVIIDDVEGGRMATQHLIDLGHRRIAYISDILESPFRHGGASAHRYQGYRQALAQAGTESLMGALQGQGGLPGAGGAMGSGNPLEMLNNPMEAGEKNPEAEKKRRHR